MSLSDARLDELERLASQVRPATAGEGTVHTAIVIDGNYLRPASDLERVLASESVALVREVRETRAALTEIREHAAIEPPSWIAARARAALRGEDDHD